MAPCLCFGVGGIGTLDTWLELQTGGDGLYSNFFLEGLLGIFGPFLLWIGGALLLGRLGALGPQLMQPCSVERRCSRTCAVG